MKNPCFSSGTNAHSIAADGVRTSPAPEASRKTGGLRTLLLLLLFPLILKFADSQSYAQLVNRGVARWAVADRMYGGRWYSPVQWGTTGYWYDPVGAQTAYGNAVRAQAALTMAQGQARRDNAVAAQEYAKAQAQAMENKARYLELQQQRKQVRQAAEAKKAEEQQERASKRVIKRPVDIYPRLSMDELDPTTGKIVWPKCLLDESFREDRARIEATLQSIATNGPDERSAGIISETASQMKSNTSQIMKDYDFTTYSDARKFLCSLSVEGYHALEEL